MSSPNITSAVSRPDVRDAVYREWDLNRTGRLFVADLVLPRCDVEFANGRYKKISREEVLKRVNNLRGPDGRYAAGSFKVTETTFDTEERGGTMPIDRNKAAQLNGYFDSRREAAGILLFQHTLEHEILVAGLIQATGTFGNADVAVKWLTYSTATPLTDIDVGKAAVLNGIGLPANTVVMADATWEAFRKCDQVLDRIGFAGGNADPRMVTRQAAAAILDVDQVVVGAARYNTAKEGQAASLAGVWDSDKVWIGYVAPAPRLDTMCAGFNLHWPGDGSEYGWRVEEYYDEDVRSDVVRVRRQVKPAIRAASCGYIKTAALTKA